MNEPFKVESAPCMTVLIVDDDPDSLELIDRYVKYGGYESLIVDSGVEAIEIVKKEKPEAIILDAVMPEVTGLDVIRWAKKNEETRDIPIIMISALGQEIKLILDEETQADHYFSKPFSGKELLIILDKLVNQNS